MRKEIKIAITAAIQAGREILSVYNGDFDFELKDDNSPLTKADQQANEVINSFLINTEIPIISEENKQIDFDNRKDWNQCWIVDPLDGTKEFIKRNGEFTVNIALIENGAPKLGVIYVPVFNTLYFGDVDLKQSFKYTISDFEVSIDEMISNAESLEASRVESDLIRVVGSRSHMNHETQAFIDNLKSANKQVSVISKGSSLKFCLVAEGQADVYPRFAPTMEWDTAAAHAICEASGISVIAQDTGKPLTYNKENLLNPWFLVSKNPV